MITGKTLILLGVLSLGSALQAQVCNLSALVGSDATASRNETQRIRSMLRNGTTKDRAALCDQLKNQLRTASDPTSICQVSLAMAPGCDDESVFILVSKLSQRQGDEMDGAIFRSVRLLVAAQPSLKSATRTFVAGTSEAFITAPSVKRDVVEAALTTLASLGSEGFDRLVALKTTQRSSILDDLYYSLLANTGDARALPILRGALEDPAAADGRRSQVVGALGQIFRAAQDNGIQLPAKERVLCSQAIERVLGDPASDQSYESAMQALANVNSASPLFEPAVFAALSSPTASRREAALSAMHASDQQVDARLLPLILEIKKSDPDESVQALAGSVIDKSGVVSSE